MHPFPQPFESPRTFLAKELGAALIISAIIIGCISLIMIIVNGNCCQFV